MAASAVLKHNTKSLLLSHERNELPDVTEI